MEATRDLGGDVVGVQLGADEVDGILFLRCLGDDLDEFRAPGCDARLEFLLCRRAAALCCAGARGRGGLTFLRGALTHGSLLKHVARRVRKVMRLGSGKG